MASLSSTMKRTTSGLMTSSGMSGSIMKRRFVLLAMRTVSDVSPAVFFTLVMIGVAAFRMFCVKWNRQHRTVTDPKSSWTVLMKAASKSLMTVTGRLKKAVPLLSAIPSMSRRTFLYVCFFFTFTRQKRAGTATLLSTTTWKTYSWSTP